MSLDAEEQDDELLALASIYEDSFTSAQEQDVEDDTHSPKKGGEIAVHLELPPDFVVLEKHSRDTGAVQEERYILEHLPPLFIHFTFPELYPSKQPPSFTLSCKWLNRTQLTRLCQEMDRLWEENKGEVIMFTWSQFLKDETLNLLGFTDTLNIEDIKPVRKHSLASTASSPNCDLSVSAEGVSVGDEFSDKSLVNSDSNALNGATGLTLSRQNSQNYDSRTIQDIAPKANLLKILRDYDDEMRKKVFATKSYECKVCFMDKSGADCLEFWPCRHVYCKECMTSYFEVQISEGNIKFLRCPEDKCDSEANPKQVQELVPDTLYQRYEDMLLNSTLSSLGDIQSCPRIHCQYPVTIEDRQGHCPSCKFVFCGLCRFGWHGIEPCRIRKGELRDIMEVYLNGSLDIKQGMEDRYGKKYLTTLKDEYLSLSYLEANSKSCPKCGAKIEKIDGCNKMTCQYCSIYFCWLCMSLLDKSRPYEHYNNRMSPCFNQLFMGVEVDDDLWDDSDEEAAIFD
ncbi:E3 ubiquitin-protein ligase rnf14 [Halocaridina rubra]|uniref:RBR-type E3 ubiquitin transferase n=1 Tax=Halocaridina rubra TaxID=373956 RepID=A0AAN8XCP4_HALRR